MWNVRNVMSEHKFSTNNNICPRQVREAIPMTMADSLCTFTRTRRCISLRKFVTQREDKTSSFSTDHEAFKLPPLHKHVSSPLPSSFSLGTYSLSLSLSVSLFLSLTLQLASFSCFSYLSIRLYLNLMP